MERQWKLAKDWRPPRMVRLPRPFIPALPLGRISVAVVAVAWLIPFLVMAWQVERATRDAAFQQAPRHNISWLEARVGKPVRVERHNAHFRIWHYDRGTFQMEVCVDEKDVVRAVRYTHRRSR